MVNVYLVVTKIAAFLGLHHDYDMERVLLITGHNSWIAVAYSHYVLCYKVKESCGWQQVG